MTLKAVHVRGPGKGTLCNDFSPLHFDPAAKTQTLLPSTGLVLAAGTHAVQFTGFTGHMCKQEAEKATWQPCLLGATTVVQ